MVEFREYEVRLTVPVVITSDEEGALPNTTALRWELTQRAMGYLQVQLGNRPGNVLQREDAVGFIRRAVEALVLEEERERLLKGERG